MINLRMIFLKKVTKVNLIGALYQNKNKFQFKIKLSRWFKTRFNKFIINIFKRVKWKKWFKYQLS
jgi:hypothetical protein